MNRNVESHFALTPSTLDMKRSVFDKSFDLKTTFNAGKLVPIYVEPDVLPGDTFNLDFGALVRMSPNVHPTMDNCYLDVFFFFVPNRLVWEHWKEFCGENSDGFWIPNTEYSVPTLAVPGNSSYAGFEQGSLADYMGLPTGKKGFRVNLLPFRAYALIWNEWFRDQNLQTPCIVPKVDNNANYAGMSNSYVSTAYRGGQLCPVNKYHDYFTSLLPGPMKGPDVMLPITNPLAPIHTLSYSPTSNDAHFCYPTEFSQLVKNNDTWSPQNFYLGGIDNVYPAQVPLDYVYGTPQQVTNTTEYKSSDNPGGYPFMTSRTPFTLGHMSQIDSSGNVMRSLEGFYADVSEIGTTISALRTSFQVQKFYEKRALYGSRYTEIVRSFFGVTSPDARLQRPEYLGGARIPINISQVVQTSSTDSTSPQANVAAYSLTTSRDQGFRYSSTEHGMLFGLCCVRTEHTYQQGIPRGFLRTTVFDYYWPTFAAISNQPVYNKQIYLQGSGVTDGDGNIVDNQTFGFSEAWADYRYANTANITGQFRSNAIGTLDSWHYADNYASLPTLTSDWIQETAVNIDRTLAVSSAVSDQFIASFHFGIQAYRVMPLYSVPGLVDHF